MGGELGMAVLGSILTAVYRIEMGAVTFEGIAPEAIKAARDTLGGAVAAARSLNAEPGARLVGAAREAFVHAFEVTAGISSVASVLAAFMAARILRADKA